MFESNYSYYSRDYSSIRSVPLMLFANELVPDHAQHCFDILMVDCKGILKKLMLKK